jgi:hypothetical protein
VCIVTGPACGSVVASLTATWDPIAMRFIVTWNVPTTLDRTLTYRATLFLFNAPFATSDVKFVAGDLQMLSFKLVVSQVSPLPSTGGTVSVPTTGAAIIANDGSWSLVIPSGAFSTTTSISIAPTTTYPATDGLAAQVLDLKPDGTTLATPATLSVREDPTKLATGIAEGSLVMGTSSGTTWDEVVGSTVNLSNHTVSAPISHFSPWAPMVPATTVEVTPPTAYITSGLAAWTYSSYLRETATVKDANGVVLTGRTVTWSTSDATTAVVDWTGLVSAVKAGNVTITARSGSASGPGIVFVVPPPAITKFTTGFSWVRRGSSRTLQASYTGGSGYIQGRTNYPCWGWPPTCQEYSIIASYWSSPPLLPGDNNITVTPRFDATSVEYTLVVQNQAGYSVTATTKLDVLVKQETCLGPDGYDGALIGLTSSHDRFIGLSCTRVYRDDELCPHYPLNLTFEAYNVGSDWCDFVLDVNGGFRAHTDHFNNGYRRFDTAVAGGDRLDVELWTPGFLGIAGSGGGAAHWGYVPDCADIHLVATCR